MKEEATSIECPTSLYKYMSLSGQGIGWFEKMLSESLAWFSSPVDFNDPFDCACKYDTRNTRDGIVLRLAGSLIRKGIPCEDAHAKADMEIPQSGNELQEWQEQQIEAHVCRAANTGILCLTSVCNNPLMWTHYADKHTGICIEFGIQDDSQAGFVAEAQAVQYVGRCPTVNFVKGDSADNAKKALLTKSLAYSYEREWRIVRYDEGRGWKPVPKGIVTRVILGVRVSDETLARVLRSCSEYEGALDIARAYLDPETYGLGFEPVEVA